MQDKIAQATQNMIKNLEEMTGITLDEWVRIVRDSGTEKVGERINFLKSKHGLTHGYANLIALIAKDRETASETPADPVDALFAGAKAGLRLLYEQIVLAAGAFGADMVESPKRTYTSLRRSKQFAILQPGTKTRLDVGLVLKDKPPAGRLEATRSWNSMYTHRVRIEKSEDIDRELLSWLKDAYDAA